MGFAGAFVLNVAELAGFDRPAWYDIVNVPTIAGLAFGFFAFGLATLRSDAYSRTIGLLLLAPSIIFVTNIVRLVVRGPGNAGVEVDAIFASGQAVVILAIGYLLRRESPPTDRVQPTATR